MGLNSNMKDFFKTSEIKIILDNKNSFKHKLNLSTDDYVYLTGTQNLHEYTEAIVAAGAGAGIVYGGFMASLGILGQIGLGIGLISNPIGWMALAAVGTGGGAYFARQLSKKADKKFYDKIPKYIKTPLDTLGENVIDLFMPICVKIAMVDGEFTKEENDTILNYFSTQWGYNRNYIANKIEETLKIVDKFNYSDINKIANFISKETKGLEVTTIDKEIIVIVKELIDAGTSHKTEKENHLKKLRVFPLT